jgi:hypothetical protein
MEIKEIKQTSWNGIERTVYSTKVGKSILTAGSIERLIEMAKDYKEPTEGHFTKS